ncbi:MAG: class A beta-lactamase-related serine hydrolase [Armatimonadetes bacterium]|jgi:beta-lactamase class A|nr:class A beta-lactamase-related serine hydrolase [Armatimonadota bacterium]
MQDLEAELGGGVLSVAAECGGEVFLYHPDRVLPTASSIKIAIVEEVFQQELDLMQPITVTEADYVPGSGVLATLTPGLTLPLGDLVTLAISVSDNTASNLCLRAVGGPEAVNARLVEWGCTATKIHRPICFALQPGDPPHTATGTTEDFVKVLSQLGPETMKRMRQVSDTAMLPRFLEGYLCAHKPGAVTGVRNDVGRITKGERTLTLAIFTQGCSDVRWKVDNAGCLVVAKVAQRLTEHFLSS